MNKSQLLELLKKGEKLPDTILDVNEEIADYYINSINQSETEKFGIVLNEMYEKNEEDGYHITLEQKNMLIEIASKVKDKRILEEAIKYLESVFENEQLQGQNENNNDLLIAKNCLNILNAKGVRQAEEATKYLINYSYTIIYSYYGYIDVCNIVERIANIEPNSREYDNLLVVPNNCRQGNLIKNMDFIDLCLNSKDLEELKSIIDTEELLELKDISDEEEVDCLVSIFNTTPKKRDLIVNFINKAGSELFEIYNKMNGREIEIDILELIKYITDSKIENEAAESIIEIIEDFSLFLDIINDSVDTKENIEAIYNQVRKNIKTISETQYKDIMRLTYKANDELLNYVEDGHKYDQEQNEELFNEIKNMKNLTPKKLEMIYDTLQHYNRLDVVIPLIRLLRDAKNDTYAEKLYINSTKILHERYQNNVEDIFKVLEMIMESDTQIVTDPKTGEEKAPVMWNAIKFLLDKHTDKFSMSIKGKIIEEMLKRNYPEFTNYIYTAALYLPDNTDPKEVIKIIKLISNTPRIVQAKIAACYIVYWAQPEKKFRDYIGLEMIIKKITDLDYPNKVILTEEEEDIIDESGIIFSADRNIIYPDNPIGKLRDDELRKMYLPDHLEGKIPYDFWELFTNGDNAVQTIAANGLDDDIDTTSLKGNKVRVLLKERPEIKRQ